MAGEVHGRVVQAGLVHLRHMVAPRQDLPVEHDLEAAVAAVWMKVWVVAWQAKAVPAQDLPVECLAAHQPCLVVFRVAEQVLVLVLLLSRWF